MIKQLLEVIKLNLMTLPKRFGSSAVTILSIACVTGVMAGMFSVASGFQRVMESNNDDNTLLVLSEGAEFERQSRLDPVAASIIEDSGYVAESNNDPLASAEYAWSLSVTRKATRDIVDITLRGVTHAAPRLRNGFRLVKGRLFEPGRFELIVGRSAQQQFAGLELGATVRLVENDWTIVGVFENNGGVAESEVWTDLPVLLNAFGFDNVVNSVRLILKDINNRDAFEAALKADPRVNVSLLLEKDYYARQAVSIAKLVESFGIPLVIIMGLGAVFAALNTMYSSVSMRVREIATLRTLGFNILPVSISVLSESLLLALTGSLIGIAVIYAAYDGYMANTDSNGLQIAFSFAVTPRIMQACVLFSLTLGFIGGLFPAIHAGRIPIVEAFRRI